MKIISLFSCSTCEKKLRNVEKLSGRFLKEFCKLNMPNSTVMERTYKYCQSCGMPMKRDVNGGGTNADGSRNTMYCSHCFQDGKFTIRNISVEDMKERVRLKLKKGGFPGFMAAFFTRNLHKLERWRVHHWTAVE